MKKEFVTYEIALNLRELGFDKPCLATYHKDLHTIIPIFAKFTNQKHILKAPLWQQVIDWFREKHNILIYPHHCQDGIVFIIVANGLCSTEHIS